MRHLACILILPLSLFAPALYAQTTWEHRSTEDAVWTEAAEDTATVYLVHGASDFTPDYGNTLCNHIARGLNDETWINAAAEDPSPDNWPDWIMRGGGLQYISGDLPGVRMNGCWSNEWIFVAETHSEVGSSGVLRFENGNTAVIVFAHVVGSRDGLPDPAPVVIDTDGRWISHRICSQDEFYGLDACDEYRHVLQGEDDEPLIECDLPSGQEILTLDACMDRWNNIVFTGPRETLDVGLAPDHYDVVTKGDVVSMEAYPNPFNPMTTIAFSLSHDEYVRLEVFNALGQSVGVLVDGVRPPGSHTVRFYASGLPSGLYVYRLSVGSQTHTRTMILSR